MADEQWKLMRRVADEAVADAERGGGITLSNQERYDLLDILADHASFSLEDGKLEPRYFLRRRLRSDG